MMRGVLRRSGKNSRPNLRSCLSALLRRQSKLTKAAEADAAHARIVCQEPVNLRGRQRGRRKTRFQLCVIKSILSQSSRKRTRVQCSNEPPSIKISLDGLVLLRKRCRTLSTLRSFPSAVKNSGCDPRVLECAQNYFHPADRGRTANRARQNIPQ